MDFQYIIVQAGGKGTRMQHLTHNKPKALVPVNNLPIIFHLFRKYPDKNLSLLAIINVMFWKNIWLLLPRLIIRLLMPRGIQEPAPV